MVRSHNRHQKYGIGQGTHVQKSVEIGRRFVTQAHKPSSSSWPYLPILLTKTPNSKQIMVTSHNRHQKFGFGLGTYAQKSAGSAGDSWFPKHVVNADGVASYCNQLCSIIKQKSHRSAVKLAIDSLVRIATLLASHNTTHLVSLCSAHFFLTVQQCEKVCEPLLLYACDSAQFNICIRNFHTDFLIYENTDCMCIFICVAHAAK